MLLYLFTNLHAVYFALIESYITPDFMVNLNIFSSNFAHFTEKDEHKHGYGLIITL